MEATHELSIYDAIQEPQAAPSLDSAQAMAIYELLCSYEADYEQPFVVFTHDQYWQPTLTVLYEHDGHEYIDPYYIADEEPILMRISSDEDDEPYTLRQDRDGRVVVDDPKGDGR